ncbi:truncated hemoglobin [Belliella baltica DSM 15883]|uniref:Truncated hemoglobin n=1 Tax=Belliella baltica (strain DSM 15883 / CIP 108006 / LMG 21964 / BA134) TaxID=866536 RepID=I3Z913_BELBD|nr:group III truncated hemoglobin [Belliella baltica]AFL85731.1 truncated hemoglobin [Belliella baltica DSM 15883]
MRVKIESRKEIEQLVDSFYSKVRKDELLGEIFEQIIQNKWPEHLDKMYRFWETVLLEDHTYFGSPFTPHAHMPVEERHFKRWVSLFNETVDELFEGEKAERAKWQGGRMAEMFLIKINYFRESGSSPIT